VADLRPRSGMALKHGITVLNAPGTIDNSYRKEIGAILINHGHEPYTIKKGDKICQMLIRPLYPSEMEVVSKMEITQPEIGDLMRLECNYCSGTREIIGRIVGYRSNNIGEYVVIKGTTKVETIYRPSIIEWEILSRNHD
jgi:hypothetical protein